MLPENVMSHRPTVLTEAQRLEYFAKGFLVLENYVPAAWLARLQAALAELMERSRSIKQSDRIYILEEGHSAERPRLHRITSPQDQHPEFWRFISDPIMTDLAADVVGPDVKFHHAKLNVKSEAGTRAFKWHQDIQGWPHTDYSPVTIGIYLEGCSQDQGPLSFVPGSNLGPLYSMYDKDGHFVIRVRDEDIAWVREEMVAYATGGPGTTLLLHCRTLHASAENRGTRPRPLLLPVYSSADSFAYTPSPILSPHGGDVVRGRPAQYASFDTRPCEVPPDFRAGYRPQWLTQQEEEARAQTAATY